MISFDCPHCGKRTSTDREDIEYVNLGNGLPDAVFPMLPPGEERHIDQRLCCQACWDRALTRMPPGEPHPYDTKTHAARIAAINAATAARSP